MQKKTIVALVLAALVALGTFLTNGGDIAAAVKIAFDREAAAAECKALLNEQAVETPAQ